MINMLKVIVADDEIRICRLICMLADWEALGMEVIATASNGTEALEAISIHRPDILITDIRMPGCSGLELIEKAKALQPDLEIIVISGYAYFDYAQSAIKHGVGEYLLKPIQQAELMSSLRKLGERCTRNKASAATMETLKQDYDDQVNRLQEQFIHDLMNKQVESLERETISRRYHIELPEGSMQVFTLKLDYDPDSFTDASLGVIMERVRSAFVKRLSPLCRNLCFSGGDIESCGLLCFDPDNQGNIRSALREAVNQLTAQKSMFGPIIFTVGLGHMVNDTYMLPASLKSARYAVMDRLFEGTGKLLEASMEAKKTDTSRVLQHYQLSARQALGSLDRTAAELAVVVLEEESLVLSGINGAALYDLVEKAGKSFILACGNPQWEEITAQYDLSCRQCNDRKALFDCLREMQDRELTQISDKRSSEEMRPIRIAKKFVQEHYQESITLEDVCSETGFSASYFSSLFKKVTGEGFSQYLIGVRIDKAKELLVNTNYSIAEVCESVGYSDQKHFVQTFRKSTGLNPGQYRKLYG